MDVKVVGSETDVRFSQLWKAYWTMVFTFSGMVTDVRLEQTSMPRSPMDVKVVGRKIDVAASQYEKARFPM
jgi:hypothetical protein